MDKQSQEAKSSKPSRADPLTRGSPGSSRLPEPPKFYSKSYLKRYNQSAKVRSSAALQPSQAPSSGKKSSTDELTATARSQNPPREGQNSNPAEITTAPASPKSAEPAEAAPVTNDCGPTITATSTTAPATAAPAEISKNENPVKPYSRCRQEGTASSSSPRQSRQSPALPGEQDYRYSLVNAMSSARSSYFKADAACSEAHFNEMRFSAEDEQFSEWFRKIKSRVDDAIKRHKVFLIRGELPKLKEALEERGWIQKYESSRTRSLPYEHSAGLESKSLGDIRQPDGSLNERALLFALLRHVQPDLIWDCRNDFVEWDRAIAGNVLLNKYQKPGLYTSKLGMAHVLQEAHWLHETDVADVLFPRSYNPSREMAALSQDFRRSTAVALLRRFVERVKNCADEQSEKPLESIEASEEEEGSDGSICLDRIEFAIRCCEKQIAELEHEDIDAESSDESSAGETEEKWRLFSEDCERLLYKPDGLANLPRGGELLARLEECFASAQSVLEKLKKLDPQFDLNGERNIWIVKPSNLCCGSGIFMTHELKTILRKVESKPRDYYIVQKYIERPFLVHGTKFDIRQWFLVTSTFPMTIWMYKEALLRFSSRPYSYASYHEAVHLCNTAVQERYDYERRRRRSRTGVEDEPTVRDQGWDCEKLDDYLKNEGYEGSPYWDKIYPKMSQAIVLTMLAAQDFMDRRRCSFELYGADFMVMEDLSVWLIEINTNPRMHPPSSRITQRLYAGVLNGLVKVLMDQPLNPNADTGGFELAYLQSVPESQPYLGPCLFAFGKSMALHEASASMRRRCRESNACNQWSVPGSGKQCRAWTAPPVVREGKLADFAGCLNAPTTAGGGGAQPSSAQTDAAAAPSRG